MNYLFPNKFKQIGWVLFGLGIVLGIIYLFVMKTPPSFLDVTTFSVIGGPFTASTNYFQFIQDNIFNEICGILIVVGGLLAAFSKEKYEDEFISKIRLDSLVWATFFNYAVLLFALIFIFGFSFLNFMIFNMFTTLIIFLVKFNLALLKLKKQESL